MTDRAWTLRDFLAESLRIEGIHRAPTMTEMSATQRFVDLLRPTVKDVVTLVEVYAPGHRLRTEPHLNVRVGNHIAPRGGPQIEVALAELLASCCTHGTSAWEAHVTYETLHPFTDGNGRSGRALWLWMMGGNAPIGFLHQFYYQTLASSRVEGAAQ